MIYNKIKNEEEIKIVIILVLLFIICVSTYIFYTNYCELTNLQQEIIVLKNTLYKTKLQNSIEIKQLETQIGTLKYKLKQSDIILAKSYFNQDLYSKYNIPR